MALTGCSILVTGPAGQIAFPLAARLAQKNEVWGIARFSDGKIARALRVGRHHERASSTSSAPDWCEDCPSSSTTSCTSRRRSRPASTSQASIRINAWGTGHLMSRFRNAQGLSRDVDLRRLRAAGRSRSTRPRERSARREPPALRADLLCLEDLAGGGGELRGPGVRAPDDPRAHERGLRRQRRTAGDGARHDPGRAADPRDAGGPRPDRVPDPRGRHLRRTRPGCWPRPPVPATITTGAATSRWTCATWPHTSPRLPGATCDSSSRPTA